MTNSSDLFKYTSGPRDARIMLVGESWGSDENAAKKPFVGSSGSELTRILADAGINREEILITNVIPKQPPRNEAWRFFPPKENPGNVRHYRGLHLTDEIHNFLQTLYQQIRIVNPQLIIGAGNLAFWALSDDCRVTSYSPPRMYQDRPRWYPSGIDDYRGSMLYCHREIDGAGRIRVLPIYHPAGIQREWANRTPTVHDLRTRVPLALQGIWGGMSPEWEIHFRPSLSQALRYFEEILARADASPEPVRLANDVETRRGLITCIGFCADPNKALTLPLIEKDGSSSSFRSYWTPKEEALLLSRMFAVLLHPNIALEGQNYLYDQQYIHDQWGIRVRLGFDTMLAYHLLFPGTRQGLDYLSSLFCRHHRYWKDDNKEWDAKSSIDDHLRYNGEDCLRTYEVGTVLRGLIAKEGMTKQWEMERRKSELALTLSLRGVRINTKHRTKLAMELGSAYAERKDLLLRIVPPQMVYDIMGKKYPAPWFTSPKQQQVVFHDILQMPQITHRKTKAATLGKEALQKLRAKHPEFELLFNNLEELRKIGVFSSHFVSAPLDPDDRMRCSWGQAETFRWTSSTNAFGRGTNLQNLPQGNEE